MRHNQNNRRYRGGRSNGNGGGGGGGNHQHHHQHSSSGQRRINPRVHTFDSNGPDVRIRGNAFQITEKYQGLAKDAAAAGDRVLAESYLQHAEHYQRMINEANEEQARHQQQHGGQPQQQGQHQHQQQHQQNQHGDDHHAQTDPAESEQPNVSANGLEDLDQSFLVGPRRRGSRNARTEPAPGEGEQPSVSVEPRGARAAAKTVE